MTAVWQSVASRSGSLGTDPVVDKPSGTVDGDLLIAIGICAVTDIITAPAGWTEHANSESAYNKLWWKIASSEPATYTFGVTGTSASVVSISRFNGHDPVNPINATDGVITAGGTAGVVLPSISPTADDILLHQAVARLTNTSFSPPGSATERYDAQALANLLTVAGGDEVVNNGATGTRTWTSASSTGGAGGYNVAIAPNITGSASLTETVGFSADGQVNSDGSATLPVVVEFSADGDVSDSGSAELPVVVVFEADGVVESSLEGTAILETIVTTSADGVVGGGSPSAIASLTDIIRFRIRNYLGYSEPTFSTYDTDWLLREYWGRRAGIVGDLSGYTLADIMETYFPTLHYLKDVF